jgi:hypothetical protein
MMKKMMKQITAFLMLCILMPLTAGAQCPTLTQCCLPNGDFNQATYIGSSAFLPTSLGIPNSNAVPFWTATHGTPGLFQISHTSKYARLVAESATPSSGPTSEGIRTNFNFIQGEKYDITFKMRCNDPFNTFAIHNPGILSVRLMNNGPSTTSNPFGIDRTMPAIPQPSQSIIDISTNVLPYVGQNWETVTVSFVANASYGQLWFYLNSISTGLSIIMIDDVSVKLSTPTSQFHMQTNSNPNGTPTTQFTACQRIYLNGLASVNDQNHYIDVWRRATGSGNPFVWAGNYGATGWTPTPAGVVDITNAMDITFDPNYDYRIKMATQNTCTGWVESIVEFSVVAALPNPVAHIEGNTPGVALTALDQCKEVYLVETYESSHSNNYTQYFIDLWERDYVLGGQFQWIGLVGVNGWTPGVMPSRLNIKSIFNSQGIYFMPGKEYQVKLALANSCSSWIHTTTNFHITICARSAEQNNHDLPLDFTSIEDLTISPNPAENTITLSASGFEKTAIINSLGQTILANNNGSSSIDISALPSGFYMVVITNQNGTQQKATFIKN